MRATHTYAKLEISAAAYDEIAGKLRDAGYHHVFIDDGTLDMHGIGLTRSEDYRMTELHRFRNRLCILRSIDRYEVPFLSERQWLMFYQIPEKFLIHADDQTAEKIWAVIEGRM